MLIHNSKRGFWPLGECQEGNVDFSEVDIYEK